MRTRLGTMVAVSIAGALLAIPAVVRAGDSAQASAQSSLAVAAGDQVSLEYTLSDEKGVQIQTNKGEAPLVYTQGKKEILPGLEKAVEGMHVGEEKDVKIPPEEAYGPVMKEKFQEVPKSSIPKEALKVGTPLRAQSPDGQTLLARVSEIKDKTVIVDLNHPLAGKTLAFHVKVLDVKTRKAASKAPSSASSKGTAEKSVP
jgi:FKBP-type peptidyl-prolyl cis-trans isomerase SlyD